MSKINVGRVIIGGIVAGIVIDVFEVVLNGFVLAPQWASLMESLNRPNVGLSQIIWFNVIGLMTGFATVWAYAAIRPRFGAGVMTAVHAGLLVWFVGNALPNAANMFAGLIPSNMSVMMIGVGLVELIAASIAGAWFYQES